MRGPSGLATGRGASGFGRGWGRGGKGGPGAWGGRGGVRAAASPAASSPPAPTVAADTPDGSGGAESGGHDFSDRFEELDEELGRQSSDDELTLDDELMGRGEETYLEPSA